MTGMVYPWLSANYLAAFAMNDFATGAAKWQSNIINMLLGAQTQGFEDG
jgi:hypothetical protein